MKYFYLLIFVLLIGCESYQEEYEDKAAFDIYSAMLDYLIVDVDSDNYVIIINDSCYYDPIYNMAIEKKGYEDAINFIFKNFKIHFNLKQETFVHFIEQNKYKSSFKKLDEFIKIYSIDNDIKIIRTNEIGIDSLNDFEAKIHITFSPIGLDQNSSEALLYCHAIYSKKKRHSGGFGCLFYLTKGNSNWKISAKHCNKTIG